MIGSSARFRLWEFVAAFLGLAVAILSLTVVMLREVPSAYILSILFSAMLMVSGGVGLLYVFFVRPLRRGIPGLPDSWSGVLPYLKALSTGASAQEEMVDMLFQSWKEFSRSSNFSAVLQNVVDSIGQGSHVDYCIAWLKDEDGHLRPKRVWNFPWEIASRLQVQEGEGDVGLCLHTAKSFIGSGSIISRERRDPSMDSVLDGTGSWLHIPLVSEGKAYGVLSVSSIKQGSMSSWTPDVRRSLENVAKYLSIIFQNGRLLDRSQRLIQRLEREVAVTTQDLGQTNARLISRVQEARGLYEVAIQTAASLNLESSLRLIIEKVQELLGVGSGGFFLIDRRTSTFRLLAPALGLSVEVFRDRAWPIDALPQLSEVVRKGEARIIERSSCIDLLPHDLPIDVPSSAAVIPMKIGSHVQGVFVVLNKQKEFRHEDLRVLSSFVYRVPEVIRNLELYDQSLQRVQQLETLKKVSGTISAEPNLEETLAQIARITAQSLGADLCAFLLYEERSSELVTQPGAFGMEDVEISSYRLRMDTSQSLSVRTFQEGQPFVSPDVMVDPRANPLIARKQGVHSLLVVPLKVEKMMIGVLRLGSKSVNFFNSEHIRLASLIAGSTAVIVRNAQLYMRLLSNIEELEKLNRIKSEFISVVSHELRTPLTSVKGFVSVVAEEEAGSLNARQKKFLKVADKSIDRLTLLISDILDVSRIESGQVQLSLTVIPVKNIFRNLATDFSVQAEERRLSLEFKISEKVPDILGDFGKLRQVLDNLISNAMKFTPSGGHIVISAHDRGDFILFSVKDDGIGIDPQNHEKIFEKFHQVDSSNTRKVGGTGLGLSICRAVIELHGGRIWVDSALAKGSHFQFILPRARIRNSAGLIKKTKRSQPEKVHR